MKLIFRQYTMPHLAFCFMIFAILNQRKKDNQPDWDVNYDWYNLISPIGAIFLVLFKLWEPHMQLFFKQKCHCCLRKPTKSEWQEYVKNSQQLDIYMSKTIMIETLYIVLRSIISESEKYKPIEDQNNSKNSQEALEQHLHLQIVTSRTSPK